MRDDQDFAYGHLLKLIQNTSDVCFFYILRYFQLY